MGLLSNFYQLNLCVYRYHRCAGMTDLADDFEKYRLRIKIGFTF
jgi:hypothetical protein